MERAERLKLEHAVKTGSLPDDAKVGVSSISAYGSRAKIPEPPTAPAIPPPAPPPPGLSAD